MTTIMPMPIFTPGNNYSAGTIGTVYREKDCQIKAMDYCQYSQNNQKCILIAEKDCLKDYIDQDNKEVGVVMACLVVMVVLMVVATIYLYRKC
ncbi:MAG: hypothetical protein AMQ22_00697 [Candidatus Methanofastidiosum methylothiophilum]|uniref:Uncharacterized protein n=1 Tax=Candidatus Methanofastidiosum methylothiophilum TaxID=1705564 RepID=A0A150J5X7_9EURY|nr:MAG: hypothetical protein AMQ22_00697 [Candidatus Methanofastidiosum methylthiophilus]